MYSAVFAVSENNFAKHIYILYIYYKECDSCTMHTIFAQCCTIYVGLPQAHPNYTRNFVFWVIIYLSQALQSIFRSVSTSCPAQTLNSHLIHRTWNIVSITILTSHEIPCMCAAPASSETYSLQRLRPIHELLQQHVCTCIDDPNWAQIFNGLSTGVANQMLACGLCQFSNLKHIEAIIFPILMDSLCLPDAYILRSDDFRTDDDQMTMQYRVMFL